VRVVAEFQKPRGIRGELMARSQTDIPGPAGNAAPSARAFGNGQDVPVELTEALAA
jgi:hypothetical protein